MCRDTYQKMMMMMMIMMMMLMMMRCNLGKEWRKVESDKVMTNSFALSKTSRPISMC